jgi:hypothetical protein
MLSMVASTTPGTRSVSSRSPIQTLRRRRQLLGALPMALASWAVLTGLPFSPAAARPGTLHTDTITLTGPAAEATPPAAVDGSGTAAPSKRVRTAPSRAAAGWTASIDVEAGTQSAGVSWTGAPHGRVQVRGLTDVGWTEWDVLEADPDDGPDDSKVDSGGLAWFGSDGVSRLELQVDEGPLTNLRVQAMRYEAPSGTNAFGTATAGAAAAQPDIIPRSTWTSKGWAKTNDGCSAGPITASSGVKFAVVHHTVNSNTYAASDVPALLASIYGYHTGTNGWCDMAYNFVIDRFGRTWEGRSGGVTKAIVGGHAQGFNTGSMGVSFLGQYEPGTTPAAVNPTLSALDAAGKLIGWKLGLFGVDPTGTVTVTSGGSNKYPAGTSVKLDRVIGHRDVGYTACPGANLYRQLGAIRSIAKAAQGGTATTTTTTTTIPPATGEWAPFRTASALATQQYRDVLRRSPTASELTYWTGKLEAGSWTPGNFIAHLSASAEADEKSGAVLRLYKAYFLRNADHGGYTYWLDRRVAGWSLVRLSSSFADSSEFENRYGSLKNSAFVDLVYRNVMGRAADSKGGPYWTAKLDAGMARGQVMASFSQSSEYIRKTTHPVQVVAVYEALLQRTIDADTYTFLTYGLDNAQTSLTAIANEFIRRPEYKSRFT